MARGLHRRRQRDDGAPVRDGGGCVATGDPGATRVGRGPRRGAGAARALCARPTGPGMGRNKLRPWLTEGFTRRHGGHGGGKTLPRMRRIAARLPILAGTAGKKASRNDATARRYNREPGPRSRSHLPPFGLCHSPLVMCAAPHTAGTAERGPRKTRTGADSCQGWERSSVLNPPPLRRPCSPWPRAASVSGKPVVAFDTSCRTPSLRDLCGLLFSRALVLVDEGPKSPGLD